MNRMSDLWPYMEDFTSRVHWGITGLFITGFLTGSNESGCCACVEILNENVYGLWWGVEYAIWKVQLWPPSFLFLMDNYCRGRGGS